LAGFLPLVLFAGDALAWGLQTHVFIAQAALLALPFVDPDLRRAAAKLPRLVLAGSCLPDLALIGPLVGTPLFRRSHRWQTIRRLGGLCASDHDRALAVGYASHLVADIVAHHYFVPEHEARIARLPYATHALCEWAMDEHVRAMVFAEPAALLAEDGREAVDFIVRVFRCDASTAEAAIQKLSGAERLLRRTRIPAAARIVARAFDRVLAPRFNAYMRETTSGLATIDAVLNGREPLWDPEHLNLGSAARRWHGGRLRLPALF